MNPVQFGRRRFSKIFWRHIDNKTVEDYNEAFDDLMAMEQYQQTLRGRADYKTGSIDWRDIQDVYKLTRFFEPNVIAEVGTFIGVSTMTMRIAVPHAVIHTCDVSNELNVSAVEDVLLFQYQKQSSTQMFKALADKKIGVDLMYLDGRIQDEDLQYFPQIIHDQTVFVFDDFEGIEKGVVNAMRLNGANRILIYPRENRKTAVSLPLTLLHFVPQEAS